MAKNNIRVQIKDNFGVISKKMRDYVIRAIVSPALNQLLSEYRSDGTIARMIVDKVKEGKTWESLLGGYAGLRVADLQAVLGLEDPDSALDELEYMLLDSISIRKLNRVLPGIIITIQDSAFSRLINADFASYISDRSGASIDWLEWLLLGEAKISSYRINFDLDVKESARSRSGRALMEPRRGGSWSIRPSIVAMGTSGSNFLIEAFSDGSLQNKIASKFQRDIGPALQRASNRANARRRS